MKRLALLVGAARRAGAPRGGAGASARELHGQPLQRDRGLRRPRLREVRPRPGRDPDVPGGRPRSPARIRAAASRAALELQLDGRPAVLRVRRLARRLPAGRRRPPDAALRSRLRGRPERIDAPLRDTNYAGRIGWREVVVRADARRADRLLERTCNERQRRAPRLPDGPALRARSTSRRGRRAQAGLAPGPPAPELGDAAPAPRRRRRRLRQPDRAGRPRRRRHPRLARARPLLGRRARALAGPWQGDRHGLPRRDSAGRRATRRRSG